MTTMNANVLQQRDVLIRFFEGMVPRHEYPHCMDAETG